MDMYTVNGAFIAVEYPILQAFKKKVTMEINKVLLIDDDRATNFINTRLMKRLELICQVDVVYNGLEAIVHLENVLQERQAFPELIFLDVNMPGMNGWEFIESYAPQLHHLVQKVDIILLTTSTNPDDKARASELDLVSHFVMKPLTEEKLRAIVAQYVSRRDSANAKQNPTSKTITMHNNRDRSGDGDQLSRAGN